MDSIKEFKQEYALIGDYDHWGNAMEAWFECAGQMNKRGLDIPHEWQYRPGMGSDGTDTDSYWHELFSTTPDDILCAIGNLLFRYCAFLKYKGVDY
jgi:hypothetical protein